jgi:hypothetical protein
MTLIETEYSLASSSQIIRSFITVDLDVKVHFLISYQLPLTLSYQYKKI